MDLPGGVAATHYEGRHPSVRHASLEGLLNEWRRGRGSPEALAAVSTPRDVVSHLSAPLSCPRLWPTVADDNFFDDDDGAAGDDSAIESPSKFTQPGGPS